MLVPKFISCIKGYTKEQLFNDFIAGIIIAIIAFPLAIAFAIASGVSPERGLHTAIIGGFIVSLLGGSRVQIGGPTGAFVIIVYGIIQKYGMEGLIIATIMAGCILVILGFLKLGALIKYIPSSITTGFTCGIAIVIFSTQVKDFLGLNIGSVPSEFIGKWAAYFQNINTVNYHSLFIAVWTLIIMIAWPKMNKKIPGAFIAIIAATAISIIFKFKVDTIGTQFGELSSSLPRFIIPKVSFNLISGLMFPALTIAILAGIESLLSAVVADGMIGSKHRSNMELVAQGVANILSGAFGGIPVTGAIARTAANIKNGGRTPIAGIIHSLGVLLIMLLFISYVKLVPMSSLAAVLMMVAYNMGEWESFRRIRKAPKSDALVFIVTFILTIFLDLVVAIGVGVVLASFLFVRKMAEITDVKCILDELEDRDVSKLMDHTGVADDISIYEISGPFFYGASEKLVNAIHEMGKPKKILILKMTNVPFMDSTAYHSFEMLHRICEKHRTKLIVLHLQDQPKELLKTFGYLEKIGKMNVCDTIEKAIERANSLLNPTYS